MKKIICAFVVLCVMVSGAYADVEINAENFPDDVFREYISGWFYDRDRDGRLSDTEISQIMSIFIIPGDSSKISSLKGIEYFTELTNLECENLGAEELDLRSNAKLISLDISQNSLTRLDLSQNTELRYLSCGGQIRELDLSNNTELVKLMCSSSMLESIDLSHNEKLEDVHLANCMMKHCNLGDLTNLISLDVGNNDLTSIDISKNTALRFLDVTANQLMSLDVRANKELTNLYCSVNLLTELDLSNNNKIKYLTCGSNRLTRLELDNNTALRNLYCIRNRLAYLDLSRNSSVVRSEIGIQSIRQLYVNATNDAVHPYSLNFADYMPSSRISGIVPSSVQGFLDDNYEVETVYSGGIASFANYPAKITYNYMAGFNDLSMDVTIRASDAYRDLSLRNHVYRLFTDQDMTWNSAKEYCESLGGHLATVTDDAEMEVIAQLVKNAQEYDNYGYSAYVGGIRENGKWKWVTGEYFNQEVLEEHFADGPYLLFVLHNDNTTVERYSHDRLQSVIGGGGGFICEWEPASADFIPFINKQRR